MCRTVSYRGPHLSRPCFKIVLTTYRFLV